MEAQLAVLAARLETLIGNASFRSDFDIALSSPAHLMAIGEHNINEYERMKATDHERQERFDSLASNILASVLQKEAIEHCGNTDDKSIRHILYNWHNEPGNIAYWEKFTQCAKTSLNGLDFDEEQLERALELLDALPYLVIEVMIELIKPTRLINRARASSIVMAFADIIIDEARDVDRISPN
ncbi:hypothetical protein ACFLTS_05940 [Chloroflexota bacterium]